MVQPFSVFELQPVTVMTIYCLKNKKIANFSLIIICVYVFPFLQSFPTIFFLMLIYMKLCTTGKEMSSTADPSTAHQLCFCIQPSKLQNWFLWNYFSSRGRKYCSRIILATEKSYHRHWKSSFLFTVPKIQGVVKWWTQFLVELQFRLGLSSGNTL